MTTNWPNEDELTEEKNEYELTENEYDLTKNENELTWERLDFVPK